LPPSEIKTKLRLFQSQVSLSLVFLTGAEGDSN